MKKKTRRETGRIATEGGYPRKASIPSREGWGREIIIVVAETDKSGDILEGQPRPCTCIWIHIMCIII